MGGKAKCKTCGVNDVEGNSDICSSCGLEVIKKAAASPARVKAAKKLLARKQQKKNADNN